ncbi:glycosyl transferase, group 1 [Ruegeria lacuscaerulensis ITI-1157]|nr:glycosyl transferase, group 1 [Ruegeria lacuscaerulensis ITI-1157]SHJ95328.1 Glycosyltransferase involved in cell wall bisynthesis [Ruegeria lacuscaerulensis ITI-1157]
MLNVNHISYSCSGGGAAIAARRLHDALLSIGADSYMTIVDGPENERITKFTPKRTLTRLCQREFARHLRRKYAKKQVEGLASLGLAKSGLGAHLNRQSRQILNLHWVNSDMISIAEIGKLKHPVVWTFHDMWPFSGAEHVSELDRWRNGYASPTQSGFDLNRWVWKRKAASWKKKFQIVCPSNWLAECVRQSALMRDWPVTVIPNPIDTELWATVGKARARSELSLPQGTPLVLFGAVQATEDPNKGFSLLAEAMRRVHSVLPDVEAVVFGSDKIDTDFPYPVHFMGRISDESLLKRIYSAADVFVLPSRREVLGYTGIEAMSCGVPVVAFNVSGLTDLVPNERLGYLAQPFEPDDLANGIVSILQNRESDSGKEMSRAVRQHAVNSFGQAVVARQYAALYEKISQTQP